MTATGAATALPGVLYEFGYRSGIKSVDDLMAILEIPNGDALESSLSLLELRCVEESNDPPVAPGCDAGEPIGTLVEVMVWANCEPEFVREAAARDLLRSFAEHSYQLAFAYDNGTEIHVVVGTGADDGFRTVILGYEGGVQGIWENCGGELWIPSADEVTFVVHPR